MQLNHHRRRAKRNNQHDNLAERQRPMLRSVLPNRTHNSQPRPSRSCQSAVPVTGIVRMSASNRLHEINTKNAHACICSHHRQTLPLCIAQLSHVWRQRTQRPTHAPKYLAIFPPPSRSTQSIGVCATWACENQRAQCW